MNQEPVASSIWDSQRVAYEKCGCDTCKKKNTEPKELSDVEMNEIIQFLNQSRISWSGNEFIKEAMRLAIKKSSEK